MNELTARGFWGDAWRRLLRNPSAIVSALLILLVTVPFSTLR